MGKLLFNFSTSLHFEYLQLYLMSTGKLYKMKKQLLTVYQGIVKILNLYIILSCTHLPLLSSIYSFKAMYSLLVTM